MESLKDVPMFVLCWSRMLKVFFSFQPFHTSVIVSHVLLLLIHFLSLFVTGVVLLKSFEGEAYQENSVDVTLASVYANSTAQASKLQFGKNKSIISWQKDRMIFHINASPYFVSIISAKDGNAGALLQLVPQIIKVLEPLNEIE